MDTLRKDQNKMLEIKSTTTEMNGASTGVNWRLHMDKEE